MKNFLHSLPWTLALALAQAQGGDVGEFGALGAFAFSDDDAPVALSDGASDAASDAISDAGSSASAPSTGLPSGLGAGLASRGIDLSLDD